MKVENGDLRSAGRSERKEMGLFMSEFNEVKPESEDELIQRFCEETLLPLLVRYALSKEFLLRWSSADEHDEENAA